MKISVVLLFQLCCMSFIQAQVESQSEHERFLERTSRTELANKDHILLQLNTLDDRAIRALSNELAQHKGKVVKAKCTGSTKTIEILLTSNIFFQDLLEYLENQGIRPIQITFL